MTAVAVEVWTINGGIHLDNFAIGSIADVAAFAEETFELKKAAEKKAGKKEEKSKKAAQRQQTLDSNSSLLDKAKVYALMAVDYLQENPIAMIASIAAGLIPILLLLFFGSGNTVSSSRTDANLSNASDRQQPEGEGEAKEEADAADEDKKEE